jgi:hypothetical protein
LTVINNIRMSLLAAWLGAAIYFSAVVAPSVFGVLRSAGLPNANEIAGTIVTRTLSVVNTSGFVLSMLLLITTFVLRESLGRASLLLQIALLTIVAAATGVGEWVIAPKMRGLRAAMRGQIDLVALNDPNRMAFAALHSYSVAALSVAMLATVAVIFLMVSARGRATALPTK